MPKGNYPASADSNSVIAGPQYVLCGCRDDGTLIEEPGQPSPSRRRGLLWGKGSPMLANLSSKDWAIVQIPRYIEIVEGDLAAVEFEENKVFRYGDPFEMVVALVELGADPDTFSFEVRSSEGDATTVAGDWGLVRISGSGIACSGNYGRAQTGNSGIARVGHSGFACTDAYGVAFADELGTARTGDYGIAVSDGKRFGEANAGSGGIAIGRGRYKRISAGEYGIAVAQGSGRAEAGANGVAICWTDVAHAGADGIAIGTTVSGDLGTFLVATYLDFRTGTRSHAVGTVGCDGLEPFQAYVCVDGQLARAETALDRDVIT